VVEGNDKPNIYAGYENLRGEDCTMKSSLTYLSN